MIDFGIVHKDDIVTAKALNVTNGTTTTELNDVLKGSFSGATDAFGASGNLDSGLAAGAVDNSSLTVSLNTVTAGIFSSTATASFKSSNDYMTDLDLGSTDILLNAQVNNYANPVFDFVSGSESLSGSGLDYTLDFGNVSQFVASAATLRVVNDVTGPADLVDGSFVTHVGTAFDLGGFNPFYNLAGQDYISGLSVSFITSVLGSFSNSITLSTTGHNGSGYRGALADINLTIRGNVVDGSQPVPEPATMLLFATGLAGLAAVARRKRS